MSNLTLAYHRAGKLDLAVSLAEQTLEKRKRILGPEHADTVLMMFLAADAYRDARRLGEAEPLFVEALPGLRRTLGLAHATTQKCFAGLIDCYDKLHQPDKAEPLWRELAVFWKEKAGIDSPEYAAPLASLSLNLLEQKKFTDAEPLLRECLSIREKKQPDDWRTHNTKSMLGGSLLGQKKYAEAEPLLLAGYEGMKQHEADIPAQAKIRLTEATQRLVDLYDATGQKDKADEWRRKLPEPPKTREESNQ